MGITPIPLETLRAYKTATCAKHAGNFWFHHQTLATVVVQGSSAFIINGIIWTGLGSIVGFDPIVMMSSALGIVGIFGLLAAFISGLITKGGVTIIQPAVWAERPSFDFEADGVPMEIADMARQVRRFAPESRFWLGELWQHTTLLDPYLVVQCGDECLAKLDSFRCCWNILS